MNRDQLIRLALGCAVALHIGSATAQQVEIQGVKLEPTIQVGGAPLQLNGAGLRTRAFFKVYVAGLYVPQKSGDAGALLAQKGPRRMAIVMLRDVSADSFAGALNDGLKANLSESQLAGFRGQIDALNANMNAVGETKKGDVINFEFAPDAGTTISVNGQARGKPIPGEDFFAAVLRIWLGDSPVDGSLKRGLLGG